MDHKLQAQARIKRAKEEREDRKQESREKRIEELKEILKKDNVFLNTCKEYNKQPSFIDSVKISFSPDIDVSAKTINGEILLNEKLFNKEITIQIRYLQHEFRHVCQQDANEVHGKVDKEHYLDDENEIDAFSTQLKYMCENESAEEIQNYIENLLDHHGIEGNERKEKAKKLVEDL